MKKIMIMLGAVALAAVTQAASVDWKVTYASKGAEWKANGATVMAFAGSDYDAIVKLVTVDGSEKLGTDLAAYALDSKTFSDNRGAAYVSTSTSDAPNSMFWMIFTDGSMEAGKNVIWTDVADVSANLYEPPASGTQLGLTASSFANSGEIAAVPEPTSGLLLLLGVAGLALRRKQK